MPGRIGPGPRLSRYHTTHSAALPLIQARQRYEEDQHVVRQLRMAMRDGTTRLLSDRRWRWFWLPGERARERGGGARMVCVSLVTVNFACLAGELEMWVVVVLLVCVGCVECH